MVHVPTIDNSKIHLVFTLDEITGLPVPVGTGGGGGTGDASEATLAAILAKIIAAPATEATLQTIATAAADVTTPQPVYAYGNTAQVVAVSAVDTAVGNANDVLELIYIIPGDTAPAGSVVLKDGATTLMTWPAAMFTSVEVRPFYLNARATTGFTVSTPADVTVLALYKAVV
jgi:hypothetical protein